MPVLDNPQLSELQATAIRDLKESLRADRQRALIQVGTGSGKSFTAANVCHAALPAATPWGR